jgi:hypothetical protein
LNDIELKNKSIEEIEEICLSDKTTKVVLNNIALSGSKEQKIKLATSPFIDLSMMKSLVAENDIEILIQLASNINIKNTEILSIIVNNENEKVAAALFKNECLNKEYLLDMPFEYKKIYLDILNKDNIPIELEKKLFDVLFGFYMLLDKYIVKRTSIEMIQYMALSGHQRTMERLPFNPNITVNILEGMLKLSKSIEYNKDIELCIIQSPIATSKLLLKVGINTRHIDVIKGILKNEKIKSEDLLNIYSNLEEIYKNLTYGYDEKILELLVYYDKYPFFAIEEVMSQSYNRKIIYHEITTHSNLTSNLCTKIYNIKEHTNYIAENANLSILLINKLSMEPYNRNIYEHLLRNNKITIEFVKYMLDNNPELKNCYEMKKNINYPKLLTIHKNLSIIEIEELSKTPNIYIKFELFKYKNTPKYVKEDIFDKASVELLYMILFDSIDDKILEEDILLRISDMDKINLYLFNTAKLNNNILGNLEKNYYIFENYYKDNKKDYIKENLYIFEFDNFKEIKKQSSITTKEMLKNSIIINPKLKPFLLELYKCSNEYKISILLSMDESLEDYEMEILDFLYSFNSDKNIKELINKKWFKSNKKDFYKYDMDIKNIEEQVELYINHLLEIFINKPGPKDILESNPYWQYNNLHLSYSKYITRSKNISTSKEYFEEIFDLKNEVLFANLAANISIPEEMYDKLLSLKLDSVDYGLVLNVKTPKEILKKIAKTDNMVIKKQILKHPNIYSGVIGVLSKDINIDIYSYPISLLCSKVVLQKMKTLALTSSDIQTLNIILGYDNKISYHDEELNYNLAINPNIDLDIQIKLADNEVYCETRAALALNSNLKEQVMDILSNLNINKKIINNLATNPNITKKIIDKLFAHKSIDINIGLILNAAISTEYKIEIFKDSPIEVHLKTIGEIDILSIMYDYKDIERLKPVLITNPKIPLDILLEYSKSNDEDILLKISSLSNLPDTIQSRLVESKDYKTISNLIKNNKLSSKIIELIISNGDNRNFIHTMVTDYLEKISDKTLIELCEKNDDYIVKEIASNPFISREILKKLAVNSNENIRMKVASNEKIDLKTLSALAMDKSEEVRIVVSQQKLITSTIIIKMIKDEKDIKVMKNLSNHENITEEGLKMISNNSDSKIRSLVAHNAMTDTKKLFDILLDKELEEGYKNTILTNLDKNQTQDFIDVVIADKELNSKIILNAIKNQNIFRTITCNCIEKGLNCYCYQK